MKRLRGAFAGTPGLAAAGRVVLSVHFLSELYDKLARFWYWVAVCEGAGQPFPVFEMALVTALLAFGAPCLLLGRNVQRACAALLVFQLPTTLLFESSAYTKLDSVSVMGGLLLAMAAADPPADPKEAEARVLELSKEVEALSRTNADLLERGRGRGAQDDEDRVFITPYIFA